ncbi:hypothetical protein TNCV_4869991 [Trichonephila clavipes]|nr:hypothetical protein TNCV_4869991 [Trichonephila clavipes]
MKSDSGTDIYVAWTRVPVTFLIFSYQVPVFCVVVLSESWRDSDYQRRSATTWRPDPPAVDWYLTDVTHTEIDWTATAGSDVVQSGRPIFDDFFQYLWPYIGNNTTNVVFQIVKRLWLIRIDQ